MRSVALVLVLIGVFVSQDVWAASYQRIDGTIVDPIQNTYGGDSAYSGPNLEPGADLYGAAFIETELRYANLSYANLSNANLLYASLNFADLSYADLSYADLDRVELAHLARDALLAVPRLEPLDDVLPPAGARQVEPLRELLQVAVGPVLGRVEERRVERVVRRHVRRLGRRVILLVHRMGVRRGVILLVHRRRRRRRRRRVRRARRPLRIRNREYLCARFSLRRKSSPPRRLRRAPSQSRRTRRQAGTG